jgi:hypothetical protein
MVGSVYETDAYAENSDDYAKNVMMQNCCQNSESKKLTRVGIITVNMSVFIPLFMSIPVERSHKCVEHFSIISGFNDSSIMLLYSIMQIWREGK